MYNYDSFLCYLQSCPTSCVLSSFLLSSYRLSVPTSSFLSYSSVPTVHIFLFNSLFLSMLPTVSHHPSPCYHLSFPKRDFSAYFLLPFLSDLREKMFLLSSFSCLIIFLYNNNDRAGENTSTNGLRLGDTIWAVFDNVGQYLRWREKDKYDVGRG